MRGAHRRRKRPARESVASNRPRRRTMDTTLSKDGTVIAVAEFVAG
jgi:hypothetical protein